MSGKTIYIWLTLVAGAVVCKVTQLTLHRPFQAGEYIWLSIPFLFLTIYLAIKQAKLSLSTMRVMWSYAIITAFVIYVIAFNYMEMHEIEGQRISGTGISPRNVLIFFLLPFATVLFMWVSMLVGKALEGPR